VIKNKPPLLVVSVVSCLNLIFALQRSIAAQTPTGAIAGIVSDSAGAYLAGAHISPIDNYGRLSRDLSTSSEGHYVGSFFDASRQLNLARLFKAGIDRQSVPRRRATLELCQP